MLILFLTCTMTSILASSAVMDAKELKIDSGMISGVKATLNNGLVVNKYLGIPYAQAERFERPVNVASWKGVKKCESFGPVCYQEESKGPFGVGYSDMSEDCLNLNVYVPSNGSKNDVKPVMFWIYGGSFLVGSNRNADGSYLAALGKVIVVTINYRLRAFGFLSDRRSGFKGNYGLYDQLAALKWVKRNIATFGGDPNRVTIFGNSFGSVSVSYFSVSPLAKGLFKYAIMQSGSSLSPFASGASQDGLLEPGIRNSKFNCTGYNSTKVCLKSMDALILTKFFVPRILYLPFVDGEIITDESWKLLQSGKFSQESTLMGVALIDGSCFTDAIKELSVGLFKLPRNESKFNATQYFSYITSAWGILFPKYQTQFPFKFNQNRTLLEQLTRFRYIIPGTIQQVWSAINNSDKSMRNTTNLQLRRYFLDFLTDSLFAAPAITEANYYANKCGRVFFYQVEYGLRIPDYFRHPSYLNNGYHETEKLMVFGFPLKDKRNLKTDDGRISREVIKMWSNFAKTGNPNGPDALDVQWPQYYVGNQQYMSIKPNMTVKNKLRPDKMQFWNQFVASYFQTNTTRKDSSEDSTKETDDIRNQVVVI